MSCSAPARRTAAVVSQRYEHPTGAVAVLAYVRHAAGTHAVRYYGPEGEWCRWDHDAVEAARQRWRVLAARLRREGYELLK